MVKNINIMSFIQYRYYLPYAKKKISSRMFHLKYRVVLIFVKLQYVYWDTRTRYQVPWYLCVSGLDGVNLAKYSKSALC